MVTLTEMTSQILPKFDSGSVQLNDISGNKVFPNKIRFPQGSSHYGKMDTSSLGNLVIYLINRTIENTATFSINTISRTHNLQFPDGFEMEYDIVVKMPPLERIPNGATVRSIRDGKLKVVEPEDY
jgi:hypothetical protein